MNGVHVDVDILFHAVTNHDVVRNVEYTHKNLCNTQIQKDGHLMRTILFDLVTQQKNTQTMQTDGDAMEHEKHVVQNGINC